MFLADKMFTQFISKRAGRLLTVICCQYLAELYHLLPSVLISKCSMIKRSQILLVSVLLLLNSCITQFVPKTSEDKEILVVEGLITDRPGMSSVKLTKSLPLGGKSAARPLSGCIIMVSDDLGSIVNFTETLPGNLFASRFISWSRGKVLYPAH